MRDEYSGECLVPIEYDTTGICHNENNWYVLSPSEGGYVKINRLHFRILGILENWPIAEADTKIGHIEAVGDINKKGDAYDWDYLYEWNLKQDGPEGAGCDDWWCFPPWPDEE